MVDHIINQMGHLGSWGYLAFFLLILLECQALVGLVTPGESLVLVGGFLASQELFNLADLIVVITLGAMVGDSISFEFGRRLGRGWLLKHGHRVRLRPAHVEFVEGFIARHGGKAVFVGHFMHVMRALMPFVAGASRMRYMRFLVYNAAGCVVWATLFVLLGYCVGESWRLVSKWLGYVSGGVVGVALITAWLVWRWRCKRTRESDGRMDPPVRPLRR